MCNVIDKVSKMSDKELLEYKKKFEKDKTWCAGYVYKQVKDEIKKRGLI